MRFLSMEAVGVDGGPFGSISFAGLKQDVHEWVDTYLANTRLNWNNTLARDKGIPYVYGGANLFASFVSLASCLYSPSREHVAAALRAPIEGPHPATVTGWHFHRRCRFESRTFGGQMGRSSTTASRGGPRVHGYVLCAGGEEGGTGSHLALPDGFCWHPEGLRLRQGLRLDAAPGCEAPRV
ncbi:hypothetical protein [Corallococcus sp. EGB]|uniref:hypothetical protein n=1 Tax=Corallococcus sp. EGB TaxID=1521117 RepID=UPI001CBBCBEF|nr:hypothetical protein [Corallococcus sp. EGB]